MSDIQWVESLEEEYVNLHSIIRIFIGHDRMGQLLSIIGVTQDRSIHTFYTLPKLGEVISRPKGDIVITRELANSLMKEFINQLSLFVGNIFSNKDLKEAIELAWRSLNDKKNFKS